MQIKIISVPIIGGEEMNDELNKFLRSVKVLEVEQRLEQLRSCSYWSFCIRYIDSGKILERGIKERVDYKDKLSVEDFEKFSKLRAIRKSIAEEESLPAFAIFTDEELSNLASLPILTADTMKKVKGVGAKKVEKYAVRFLKALEDEKS